MSHLPFEPRLYSYRGADERRARKVADDNKLIRKVADHVNRIIAACPYDGMTIIFENVATDVGAPLDLVKYAFSVGGTNGWTLEITTEDRRALAAAGFRGPTAT